jgi:predicted DNA-binding transcriptional regulator AlpA
VSGYKTPSRLLTAEELAARWQVKVSWVYAKTRAGEIPNVPLPGRYYRYRPDVIEHFERGELQSNHNQKKVA